MSLNENNVIGIRIIQSFVICIMTLFVVYQLNPGIDFTILNLIFLAVISVVLTYIYYQFTQKRKKHQSSNLS